MLKPVKQIPFDLGLHLLLLNRRQLPHFVDPKVVVVEHIWLLSMFEFPHDGAHQVVV